MATPLRLLSCPAFGVYGPAPVESVPVTPACIRYATVDEFAASVGGLHALGHGWFRTGKGGLLHRCSSWQTAFERHYAVSGHACPNCREILPRTLANHEAEELT